MTAPENPGSPEEKIRDLIFGSQPSAKDPKDEQIANLQAEVQRVQEKAAEERFLWVLVVVVIIDMMFLGAMSNWSAPLVIGIVELIGLVIWADRCGVNAVMPLVDRLSGVVGGAVGRSVTPKDGG